MAELDALERMFSVLVRTIRTHQKPLLTAPFTVADLHQKLLPYRHFRRDLELDSNQEYELVLMELLSGARGYLDVDERLRDQLTKELNASTPDPLKVRELADAQVSLNAQAAAKVRDVPEEPRQPRNSGVVRAPKIRPDALRCRYCGGELPEDRELNFCPRCGQNLQILNCPGCGASVESGWSFCVACGKSVPESFRDD